MKRGSCRSWTSPRRKARSSESFSFRCREETKELILCTPALSGSHVFVRTDSTLWRLGE